MCKRTFQGHYYYCSSSSQAWFSQTLIVSSSIVCHLFLLLLLLLGFGNYYCLCCYLWWKRKWCCNIGLMHGNIPTDDGRWWTNKIRTCSFLPWQWQLPQQKFTLNYVARLYCSFKYPYWSCCKQLCFTINSSSSSSSSFSHCEIGTSMVLTT